MPDFLELLLQDTGGKACLCRPLTQGQGSWIGPLPSALLCIQICPQPPLVSHPEPDSQPSPGGEAAQAATRRPPHLFRGLAGPAPRPCQNLTNPPKGRQLAPHVPGGLPGRAPHPAAPLHRPRRRHPPPPESPLPQEHSGGVAGPLQSESGGHPGPPLSPPCPRPLPTPGRSPADAPVGTLRTPL